MNRPTSNIDAVRVCVQCKASAPLSDVFSAPKDFLDTAGLTMQRVGTGAGMAMLAASGPAMDVALNGDPRRLLGSRRA